MIVSQSAEYALRAVVWLASRPGETLGTLAIAEGTRVPPGYLSKVLQGLARGGLVRSCPGRTGGFVLAHDPAELTVLDVVSAVDPQRRIHECPLGIESHGTRLCPLHRSLDRVAESAEQAFRQVTISQLLIVETASPPLCDAGPARGGNRRSSNRGSRAHAARSSNRLTKGNGKT